MMAGSRTQDLDDLRQRIAQMQAIGAQHGQQLTATVEARVLVQLMQRCDAAERVCNALDTWIVAKDMTDAGQAWDEVEEALFVFNSFVEELSR